MKQDYLKILHRLAVVAYFVGICFLLLVSLNESFYCDNRLRGCEQTFHLDALLFQTLAVIVLAVIVHQVYYYVFFGKKFINFKK